MFDKPTTVEISAKQRTRVKQKCLEKGFTVKQYIYNLIEKDLETDEIASN